LGAGFLGQIPADTRQHEARGGGLLSRRGGVYSAGHFYGPVAANLQFFEVIVEMLRPVPPPVLIPVAMLFFGLEDKMKIFVIFFSCAWPILLNTLDGVRSIDPVLANTAPDVRLVARKTLWQIVLPAARRRS
jgi:ABC-type nitrate/sulfonate/bicarbonate transport system permease component